MNILMIGGTEFFGRCLVNKLLKAGHHLTLLTRGNNRPSELWNQVEHIKCDRHHYVDFYNKVSDKQFDTVIDTVSMNQQDMESIIDTFGDRKEPPHYLFCSTVAVYDGLPVPADGFLEEENLEFQEGNDWKIQYANDKRAAEQYLRSHHGSMPYTILRPTVIEGSCDPYKRTWFWIQRLHDGKPIILSTLDQNTLYRHVYVEDVAEAFFLAVGNKNAFNQVYNVAGEEILTIERYVKCISEILNKREIKIAWVSPESIAKFLPSYSLPVFYEQVRLIPNIDKVKADLNYKPTSIQQWMEKTIEFFRNEAEDSVGYVERDIEEYIAKFR